MVGILITAAASIVVIYALAHHVTVAQAKAEAEAVIAKVKVEIQKIEQTGYADVTSAVARIKALIK